MTLNQTSVVYGYPLPDVAASSDTNRGVTGSNTPDLAHLLSRFKSGEISQKNFLRLMAAPQPSPTPPAPDMASMFVMFQQMMAAGMTMNATLPSQEPPAESKPTGPKHPGILKPQCPHNLLGDVIEAYLAQYIGKDQTRYSRCQTWADRIGHLSLAELNRGVIRDELKKIASEPPLG